MTAVRMLHVSDNHSVLAPLSGIDACDLVVHSGDLMPNRTRGVVEVERSFQLRWLDEHRDEIWAWLGGGRVPVIFCAGNHDYARPARVLDGHRGLRFVDITDGCASFFGLTFYGYPWWPTLAGEWNYEGHYQKLVDKWQPPDGVDVVVAHCPPYGCLDACHGRHIGNPALTRALEYDDRLRNCQAVLCGHCHESGGAEETVCGVLVSNAATTLRLLTVEAP